MKSQPEPGDRDGRGDRYDMAVVTTSTSETYNGNVSAFRIISGLGGVLAIERPAVEIDGATVACASCRAWVRMLFSRNVDKRPPGVFVCLECAEVTW